MVSGSPLQSNRCQAIGVKAIGVRSFFTVKICSGSAFLLPKRSRCPVPFRVYLRGGRRTMKLTHDELEFLSAWAREEGEPACYQLPSELQDAHEQTLWGKPLPKE